MFFKKRDDATNLQHRIIGLECSNNRLERELSHARQQCESLTSNERLECQKEIAYLRGKYEQELKQAREEIRRLERAGWTARDKWNRTIEYFHLLNQADSPPRERVLKVCNQIEALMKDPTLARPDLEEPSGAPNSIDPTYWGGDVRGLSCE